MKEESVTWLVFFFISPKVIGIILLEHYQILNISTLLNKDLNMDAKKE